MAAGLLQPLVGIWKEWGILVLVLLSLSLQVILLITAEIRRRKDSGIVKVVVWSSYLLADTTAIYALGHMSVISPTSQEQQLMAFWAPFLLLHLGGQDNITAYSIEDNRLWLRHLQIFVVQLFAAAYVLYESSIVARRTLLRPAAILIFVVGVLKYGERVCALKLGCRGSNLFGKNYHRFESNFKDVRALSNNKEKNSQIYGAHALLGYPKKLLEGPISVSPQFLSISRHWEYMYGVAEMQLSLMHDVFYSKAELIHTWYGYCIRVFSLPATVATLLLFHRFSEKDGYRRADVKATYVLLAGAVVLEITSVLRVMFSNWTYGKLLTGYQSCATRALVRLAFWSHELAKYAMCRGTTRYWSGSMGQHNFIYMCSQCKDSRGSKIARWMGWEDWWNMRVYTSSVPVSADIVELLKEQVLKTEQIYNESPDHIHNSRGRAALKRRPGLYEELSWSVDTEPDETIIVWHIATHVYLSWYEENHVGQPHHLAKVNKELSNYMMYLLAARPYMVPDNASRQKYVRLCGDVIYRCKYSSEADLLRSIREQGDDIISQEIARPFNPRHKRRNLPFDTACLLAVKLISIELKTPDANMLKLISQVWVDLLCYVAYRCRPDSHARQLSNGGEFTTVVAILLDYRKCGYLTITGDNDNDNAQYFVNQCAMVYIIN